MSGARHIAPMTTPLDRKRAVARAVALIKKEKMKPTAIVGCGISGISFASALAYKLNLNTVFVRKSGDNCNSCWMVEGLDEKKENKLCIVDDLIASGQTVKHIVQTIKEFHETRRDKIPIYSFTDGLLYWRTERQGREESGIKFHGIYEEN